MDLIVLAGLTLAVTGAAVLVLQRLVVPHLVRRFHDDAATFRWVPGAPSPRHRRHEPMVAAYAAEGYRVDSVGEARLGTARITVTLMAHPDHSVADIVSQGPRGRLRTSVTSLLTGGASVLETMVRQGTPSAPGRLIQVLPGASVADLVHQHRAGLGWLSTLGVAGIPHGVGPPGVFEAASHIVGRCPPPTVPELRALAAGSVVEHHGPLWLQWGIGADLAAAGLVGSPPPAQGPPSAWPPAGPAWA